MACAICFAIALSSGPAWSGELILNLDTRVNGTAPSDPTPWVTLDFKDISTNEVQLTISNNLQSSEYLPDVLFNSTKTLNSSSFSYVSGKQVSGFTFNTDGGSQVQAGIFSVDFSYPTPNGGGRLSGGTQSVYDITATGLTAASFNVGSTGSPSGYLGAADVRGIPSTDGTTSGSIGTTTAAVPEPSTLMLGALGALGVLAWRRFGRHGRA
jgi:hypothetical protein